MSRRKLTIFILSALVLAAGITITYLLMPRATLLLSVAPEEFTVSVYGKEHTKKTGDTLKVSPGDVIVTISHEGFTTLTKKITIKNGETVEILEALVAQTEDARKLLATEKSQAIIQRIQAAKTKEVVDDTLKNYPIMSVLPIKDKYYTIEPCASREFPKDTSKIAICVNLYNLEAKPSSIEDVKSRGYNLDDYETYFVDKSYKPGTSSGAGD